MSDTDRVPNLHDALLSNGQLVTELHALKIEHTRLKAAHKRLLDSVAAAPAPTPAPAVEPLTDEQKRRLIGSYFAEDWAQNAALGLLHDFELALGIGAQKGGA